MNDGKFVKGQAPWNKGKKNLNTIYRNYEKGETHHNWKGDKAGYFAIHKWLVRNFGSASKCDNLECLNKSKKFAWAKIKNKTYVHKRENFMMLCYFCHNLYDKTKQNPK